MEADKTDLLKDIAARLQNIEHKLGEIQEEVDETKTDISVVRMLEAGEEEENAALHGSDQ